SPGAGTAGRLARRRAVPALARRAGRSGRRRSGPGGHGPGRDRGRLAARFAHRPGRGDEHSRWGVAAPAAPAGRQRLGTARRFLGVKPKVLLSWSGGKDAAWALHVLRRRGDVEIV